MDKPVEHKDLCGFLSNGISEIPIHIFLLKNISVLSLCLKMHLSENEIFILGKFSVAPGNTYFLGPRNLDL